jgi:hypothetical protein
MFHHSINESMPAQPGLWLYAITKAIGHEITRVFSSRHPIHVMQCLVSGFFDPEPPPSPPPPLSGGGGRGGGGEAVEQLELRPMSVTFPDAAAAVRKCLEVPLSQLASRCESFFIMIPFAGVFKYGKARDVLGWEPQSKLEGYYYRKARL